MKIDSELAHLANYAVDDLADPVRFRELLRLGNAELNLAPLPTDDLAIINRTITVNSLSERVTLPARIYRPHGDAILPVILYCHGGGFVCGDLETGHPTCIDWARDARCCVVSVDYRLAPEHPYPTPTEDCYGALVWIAASAAELRIDAHRLAVGGQSAGGTLAAALTLMSRDRRGPRIIYQILHQLVTDDQLQTRSVATMPEAAVARPVQARNFWRHYLGGIDPVPAYAAPARAADLTGLPPAYILAAQLDAFRDEQIAYAQRLAEADVPVELHLVPAAVHGFDVLAPEAVISRRMRADMSAALREAFARPI